MKPFRSLRSKAIVLDADDVDTDQIIPARFLTTTVKQGLGRRLFNDWRYDAGGVPRAGFPLNDRDARDREILVAGRNFGCGSSREHAPWALVDWGIRVVVAHSFADIFRNNALKNGLLPIALTPERHRSLRVTLAEDPAATLVVDVAERCLSIPGPCTAGFEIDPFAQRCWLEGLDELGYLMRFHQAVLDHEKRRTSCSMGPEIPLPLVDRSPEESVL